MKRRVPFTGPGYAFCALGVMLVGAIALILTAPHTLIRSVLLLAMLVALAGIAQRWHRHVRRLRRRAIQDQHLQI